VRIEVDDLALDPRLRTETREAGGEVVISLHLRAGLHRLRFLRADGSSVERVVDVAGGERGELRLGADDATAPNGPGGSDGSAGGERGGGAQRPDAPIDQAGQDPRRGRRVARDLAISAGAVTGAGLVATVTFAGLTLDAKRDFEAALCDGACMDGERYPADEERRFERSRTATNVLAGVSAGFAAVTILVATLAARDDTRGGSRRRGAPSRDGRRAGDAASSRASIVRAAEEGRGSSRRVLVVDVQHGLRLRF
jgi:hypothetical protein